MPRGCSFDHLGRDIVGEAIRKTPGSRIAERLALGALTGSQPVDLEPRMIREQGDELLADHAGRAKNADGYRRHNSFFLHPSTSLGMMRVVTKKKPTRLNRVGRLQLEPLW